MLTLEFPPVNSTGCYRYIKFLSNLRKYGIEPIVVAPTVESSLMLWENRKVDESLLAQFPSDIEIIRVGLPKGAYVVKKKIGLAERIHFYLNYKDNASELWKPAIMRTIEGIVQNKKIDAFFVSPPPFSLCKLGSELSKKFSIPLILDMRDDWIINKGNPFPTYWHYRRIYSELGDALNQASKILVVTPQLAEMSCKAFPGLQRSKFTVVTNGFDINNFSVSDFNIEPLIRKDCIRIGYSGEFYFNPLTHENARIPWWRRKGIRKLNYSSGITKEDWTYRSPLFFLKTLKQLLDRKPLLKSKIRFEHVGNTPGWLILLVKEMGLEANFHSHGFVSKSKNLSLQSEFDALLVTSEKVLGGENYCISSKIFDAFLLQKPILGFVTEGISKEILEKSGCSVIFDPDNIEECTNQLENFISFSKYFTPNLNFFRQFTPDALTKKLVEEIYLIIND